VGSVEAPSTHFLPLVGPGWSFNGEALYLGLPLIGPGGGRACSQCARAHAVRLAPAQPLPPQPPVQPPTANPPPTARDFFLLPENYKSCRSQLVHRFGELLRKLWNTRNFRGQVRGGSV
jgi:hypothetical protein